ncbi:MAG: hypothetical protein E6J14_14410 [Chloroflexi bacterium]|nr:MAG: hypothetical protein E6J14_14410 [Chloroflexota bacterium]
MTLADAPRVALAAVRLVNGGAALVLPRTLGHRLGIDPDANRAASYVLRLFGIRTVVIGLALVDKDPVVRANAVAVAAVVHASDAASAALAGLTGQLPRRAALTATAISSVNVALSLLARRAQIAAR